MGLRLDSIARPTTSIEQVEGVALVCGVHVPIRVGERLFNRIGRRASASNDVRSYLCCLLVLAH